MDGDDLAVFLAAAEVGSIGRAAERLHAVQSAATTRIRKLENFRRDARGVTLSPTSETLLSYARQITVLLTEARYAMTDSDTPRGQLVIGAMETTAGLDWVPCSPTLRAIFRRWS